jgi:hypothetical protein
MDAGNTHTPGERDLITPGSNRDCITSSPFRPPVIRRIEPDFARNLPQLQEVGSALTAAGTDTG